MSEIQVARKNYNGIDVAKFICSILVIAIHVDPFATSDNSTLQQLHFFLSQYIARIAVPFFFIAAGYFLFRKTSPDSFDLRPVRKYIGRIVRLYVLWSILYFPLILYYAIQGNIGFRQFVTTYARRLIFVGSYTHLWYLYALIFAVIMVSFLLYKRVKPAMILILSFCLYIVGLFGDSWFGFIKPLETAAPALWALITRALKVMETTRNGLFEGFPFVCIGMMFAFYGNRTGKIRAGICFLVSMALLRLEIFLLQYFRIEARGIDMYLCLVPAAYFFFSYTEQIDLHDNKIFRTLRTVSSLVFYMHLWVAFVVEEIINRNSAKTSLNFICVALFSVLLSYFIYRLSMRERFRFLQKLYN